jgi:hypothetical protein
MVQTTFTKQKRELAKATSLIQKLRAQEVRTVTTSPEGQVLNQVKETYVDFTPEEIFSKVLGIVTEVVSQHGSRQKANAKNTGRFRFGIVEADLTVPQLRALQEAHTIASELVRQLPKQNSKLIANTVVDGRPAFAHLRQKNIETKTRNVPFEDKESTRVRTYQETYEVHTHSTQKLEIDFGLSAKKLQKLEELVLDFGTAIQVAIDEANAKGHDRDPLLEEVIQKICGQLSAVLAE